MVVWWAALLVTALLALGRAGKLLQVLSWVVLVLVAVVLVFARVHEGGVF